MSLNIGVLGAGVVGLTTAFELQKEFGNAKINIIADKFIEDTTSYVAAGIFRPGSGFSGPTENITKKWINDSYYYWENLRLLYGEEAGVKEISGYAFSSDHPSIVRNHYLENLLPLYRKATDGELKLCPGQWKHGSYFTTLVTESTKYLPWITTKLKQSGILFSNQKLLRLTDLKGHYDVLVNCTGLGSKYLFDDNKLVPIRGQVLKVKAPWVKNFFYGNFDTYIIPGLNSITLGGCRNYDSYDCEVNKYDTLSIRERCEGLVPSLGRAEVLKEMVGLRPYRPMVRVEKEVRGGVRIVHNYGHGGYGVTTAPGTSLYAVQLVKELLCGNSKL